MKLKNNIFGVLINFLFSAERLPVDEVNANFVRTVKNCIFSKSTPTPLRGPLRLAALSKVGTRQWFLFVHVMLLVPAGIERTQQDVLEGILNVAVSAAQTDDFLQFASGGRLLPGSVPLAHRYGGHQVEFLTIKNSIQAKKMMRLEMSRILLLTLVSLVLVWLLGRSAWWRTSTPARSVHRQVRIFLCSSSERAKNQL